MSLFAINAADIDAAGRSIEADLPVDWLDKQLADCDAHATAPGHLSVRLSRTGNEIVVRGKTRASLQAPCGRCLSPSKMDIEGELALLLQPAKTPAKAPAPSKASSKASASAPAAGARAPRTPRDPRNATGKGSAADGAAPAPVGGKGKRASKDKDLPEYEFASDEADVDLFDGETVVLDDFVREAILLEIPIFPLCSEDCTGIRPASSDDAIDEGAEPRVDPRLAPLGALRALLAQSKAEQGESNDDSGARPRSTSASHRKKTK
jgi:uncharacterized protein